MAILLVCLPVPQKISSALSGERVFSEVPTVANGLEPHLTLCVGNVSENRIDGILERLSKIASASFRLRFLGIERFENDALVAVTDFPDGLRVLRTEIAQALHYDGSDFTEWKRSEFRPHVTVARLDKDSKSAPEHPSIGRLDGNSVLPKWNVDGFEVWIREETGRYRTALRIKLANPNPLWPIRVFVRISAQILLFFSCFLPSVAFIGNVADSVGKNGPSIPAAIDVTAFFAAIAGTAALAASARKRFREKFARKFSSVALAFALVLFFTNVFELRACQLSSAEDYECFWIFDVFLWSAFLMVGLLALAFWVWKWSERPGLQKRNSAALMEEPPMA